MLAGLLLLPILEIAVLIAVARVIGGPLTLAWVVLDVVIGVWLIRRVGVAAWRRTGRRMAEGLTPSREVADATLIFVAGVLLVFPGFVTDLVAVLILLPLTRPLVRRPLERLVGRAAVLTVPMRGFQPGVVTDPGGRAGAGPSETGRSDTLRGEIVDE